MPVGKLIARISCNDSQASSDENIDGLRSACHDAAVLLDGARKNEDLAMRRIRVNDWARPSRTSYWHTPWAPQLIRTTRRGEYEDGWFVRSLRR